MALQSSDRLPAHLAQWSGYDESWGKYLQPADFEPKFKPAHGLPDGRHPARGRGRRAPGVTGKLVGQYVNF
jgi:hypothetical protein